MSIEWDIEELACRAMGMSQEQAGEAINSGDIDQALYDKYGMNFEQYVNVVKDLLPFTPQVRSALSGNAFHAFVDTEKGAAIVKIDVKKKDGE